MGKRQNKARFSVLLLYFGICPRFCPVLLKFDQNCGSVLKLPPDLVPYGNDKLPGLVRNQLIGGLSGPNPRPLL